MNTFGMEHHPTDIFIHWSRTPKESVKEATELRHVYDSILKAGISEKDLNLLLEASANMARDDATEEAAGADM